MFCQKQMQMIWYKKALVPNVVIKVNRFKKKLFFSYQTLILKFLQRHESQPIEARTDNPIFLFSLVPFYF